MDYDYLFIAVGMFVPGVVLFKRELLVEAGPSGTVFAISLALFIIGVGFHFTDVGRHSSSGALLAPLMSLGLYRLLCSLFVTYAKHEPRDTYMDWTPGMAADRLFNIVYFTAAFVLTMLSAIGMEELAKRGW